MSYRVLSEHDDHFVVHDGQSSFKVAKHGLGPETIAKIQSFADGGEVEEAPAAQAPAPTREEVLNQMAANGPDTAIKSAWDASGLQGVGETIGKGVTAAGNFLNENTPLGPVAQYFGQSLPAAIKTTGKAIADQMGINDAPNATPSAAAPEWRRVVKPDGTIGWTTLPPTAAPSTEPAPAATAKPPEKAPETPKTPPPAGATAGGAGTSGAPRQDALAQAEKGEIAGIQARAKAAGDEAAMTASLLQQRETAMAEMTKNFQARMEAHQARSQELFDNVMASKIDPGRFWNSRTESQRTTAAIAMILGGIGSGMTHGPNQALEIIQRNIDRDIDAQKTELGQKQTLLSHYMEQGRDMMQAHNLAKADLIDASAAQLQRAAVQYGGPKAQADAQIAVAAAQKQSFQLRQEAEMRHAQIQMQQLDMGLRAQQMQYQRYQMAIAQAAASGQRLDNVEMLPPEMRERAATLPDGRKILAKTTKGADAIDAASQASRQLNNVIGEMRQFRAEHGRVINPGSAESAKADALHLRALRAFAGTAGVPNYALLPMQELEQFKGVVRNPGKVLMGDEAFDASLEQMAAEGRERLMATLGTHASGYVPPSLGRRAGGE